MADLVERCKEILNWKQTGILRGEALRNFANPQYGDSALRIAEDETASEAMRFVIENSAEILRLREENARIRKETIEEAAKVAETGDWYGQFQTSGDERRAQSIAHRIRSLLPVEEEKR